MDAPPIDIKQQETHDDNLQKPNIYNEYLPFHESIKRQASESFDEIRENLSRTIQQGEFYPGFIIWSNALERFISSYGFYFTKFDHLKLIDIYLSLLSITDLNYSSVKICFDTLFRLMWKTRLVTRDDLTIDWRMFYHWAKLIYNNHDANYALITLPKDVRTSFYCCVRCCSPYFSATATQEILDQLRPQLCPMDDSAMGDALNILKFVLPVNLPPDLHSQGFKLWLPEFFGIWESIYNTTVFNNTMWEWDMINLFSHVAWNNIGYIEWEPWLAQIFTRILNNFLLPIGKMQMSLRRSTFSMISMTEWIIAMMGNGNSSLPYLRDLLAAIKSFYHPSNTGKFQKDLVKFILELSRLFVKRVHLERKPRPIWSFAPHESHRLTEQDITDFVNCVKEYAFISIFNKDHMKEAAEACQYLSMLRPELIVPPIVEKLFSSIDSMTEPHRFTSIMHCLAGIARQIVQQTSSYSQGQTYVLPLLMSVLPGIDSNDFEKTSVTLEFLNAILMLITCVDCSSAVHIRNDLTEIEKEVCLSTAKFEDFITEFLNRIFQMIDILSTEMSDAVVVTTADDKEYNTIELKITSVMSSIVQQCSRKIFQMVREKITNYLAGSFFSSKVRKLVAGLVRAIVNSHPVETLECLLSQTCEYIEKIIDTSEKTILTDHKGDMELTWYLILFSELVRARGDVLLTYKRMIMSVFHRSIHIIHKDSYEAVANAANNLLQSLCKVYPIDYRLTVENIDEPFVNILPIRLWGQHVDFDQLQVQFHIPNVDEIDFACEFVETFIYPELTLLNENTLNLSNDERLRSLTLVRDIALGCLYMVPRIDSKEVQDLVPSAVPFDFKCQTRYPIYSIQPKFKANLRMRLLIDIGKLLDVLVEKHPDDVTSIRTALKVYTWLSTYYGAFGYDVNQLRKDFGSAEKLFKNRLYNERQNPRFLTIKIIAIQIGTLELKNSRVLTEIDKQIALKLFELSTHRYSVVRRSAQYQLFNILDRYLCSFPVIVDPIVELLNKSDKIDHDQIKGCLHILLGDEHFFLPTKNSWTMMEKVWPHIARLNHGNKISMQKLIDDINKGIDKKFETHALIEDTNETSVRAAVALWRLLEPNEYGQIHEERKRTNIQSYNNLIETLSSLLQSDTLTWGQQKTAMSLLCLLLQKHVPIPSSCIRTFVDFLAHDNIELRKCATKGVAAFCRLQKLPRIYIEKPLDEILHDVSIDDGCHPGDRDDNLWVTIDGYKPPETQTEWEQTCFLDKSFHGYYKWPKVIKYSVNKRARYTQDNMPEQVAILYDRFMDRKFLQQFTQLMILHEDKNKINFDQTRFKLFKGLFRNFGLAFVENFMEQLYVLIREKTEEKQERSHRVAAEIVAGMIRGSKYWTLEMLDKLWQKLTPFLTEVCNDLSPETSSHWSSCFKYGMMNEDPRRMYRSIAFLHTLINSQTKKTALNEESCWCLIQQLRTFQWRIPSIWSDINEHAKELLDHPFKAVRQRIALVLSISLSFNMALPNGKSTRYPDIDQFIDSILERLRQAIEVYEKTPLVNLTGDVVEIDSEARTALNFIEIVIQMHKNLFTWCQQPVNSAIIRTFPYLCDIESIAANDATFRDNLTISRMYVSTTYLHAHLLELLIQQLEQVCTSSKWHARRVAIEFIQNLIFCNLFNARSYAKRLHQLVRKCLFDEQFEVRIVASTTLSGFYQCGYTQVTYEDLEHFRAMSKTKYFTKIDDKKVTLTEGIIKRHGGVLGLCAIVLSSPYDIPTHVPDALMLLCEHSHDPDLIQKSIKKCLSEFRHTHHDSWHEHCENFTSDQLLILADVLIPHSYYA